MEKRIEIVDITNRVYNADAAEWLGLEAPEGVDFRDWADSQEDYAVCTTTTAPHGQPYSEADAAWCSDWQCVGVYETLCEATIHAIVWDDYEPTTGDWRNVCYAGGGEDGIELLALELSNKTNINLKWVAKLLTDLENTGFGLEKYTKSFADSLVCEGVGKFRRGWVVEAE